MIGNWRPGTLGKLFGSSGDWELSMDGTMLHLRTSAGMTTAALGELSTPTRRRRLFLSTVTFELSGRSHSLTGMGNGDAAGLLRALDDVVGQHRQLKLAGDVMAWSTAFRTAIGEQFAAKGWLGRDFRNYWWQTAKPAEVPDVSDAHHQLDERLGVQHGQVRLAVELWNTQVRGYCGHLNEQRVLSEAAAAKDFFDRVERSPLTPDQIRAVVSLDERVQVIASAGSGKTSTMVAKAGYVLHRKLVPAAKILLLAFNTDAAKELNQRIQERLVPLGLNGDGVQAKTFHAFGLEIIGQATGRKPSVAPWVQDGADLEKLLQIVDRLRDTEPGFGRKWDLFRFVLSRGLPEFEQEGGSPTGANTNSQAPDFRTLQGEVVKSHGEQLIADWLFYNGVDYVYERPYEHDTVDAAHSQYHPDFYYPDINAYHEHFALDRHGMPPPEFTGYLDGVHWKRAVHRQFGTTLLETTMSELWDGHAFDRLREQLTGLGVTLDPNPDRTGHGPAPMRNEQLIGTFRTFLIHAKSNRLDGEELRQRLAAWSGTPSHFRNGIFLSLFESIRAAWDQELAQAGYIDFEDMLTLAADHLEAGHWDPGYELVMVDEMQDASHARARLAHALVNKPGRMLFAVGDDWQSINGFAGADLSVMTDFSRWFGEADVVRLERTFRSPQSICNVSSSFILKNPAQLRKHVVSSAPDFSHTVLAVTLAHADQYQRTVHRHLEKLAARVASGEIPVSRNGKLKILVLCRYRRLVQEMRAAARPGADNTGNWRHLDVQFHTIHGSKGLEADYVIVPGLTRGPWGFPSAVADDPVLHLAMPSGDNFPLAEERRLFYVALTRAKRRVLLLTVKGKESAFLQEIIDSHNISVVDAAGKAVTTVRCPACGHGQLVNRVGPYSSFLGCSSYPSCRHTQKLAPAP